MCYTHLKGKYYKEYMAQYKRNGTGAMDGITKFTILTKTSVNIADEVRKKPTSTCCSKLSFAN